MIRKALEGSVAYGLGAVLSRSLVILQAPLFSFALAPEQFGRLDILTIGINLLNLCVALEVSQGLAIYSCETKDDRERASFASTALWFTLGCYTLLLLIGAFAGPVARTLEETAGGPDLSRLFLLTAALQGIFLLVHGQLRWMLRPGAFFRVSLLYGITNLALSLLFVYGLGWGVSGILGAQALGAALASLAALLLQRRHFTLTFDTNKLRLMLKFSLPLVPSSIAVLLALYVDRAVIGSLMGMAAVGLYGVGFRFAAVVGVLVVGVGSAVTPLIYHDHREPDSPRQISRLLNYYVLAGLAAVLLLGVFSEPLMHRLVAPEYHSAHAVVPTLAAALLAGSLYAFAPGLSLSKRTFSIALISTLTAALNLLLNLALVPVLGIQGAALATLLSGTAGFALWCRAGQRLYHIPYDTGRLLTGSAAVGLALWTYQRFAISPSRPILQLGAPLLALTAAILLLLRPEERRRAWRSLTGAVRAR